MSTSSPGLVSTSCPGDVSAQWATSGPGGCLPLVLGGVYLGESLPLVPGGVCQGGVCLLFLGGVSQHPLGQTLPLVNRMTNRQV